MTKRRKRTLVSLAVLVVAAGIAVLLLTAKCGITIGTPTRPDPVPVKPVEPLEGSWAGAWSSTSRDDGGKLYCTIKKIGEGKYDAKFKATFAKMFAYTMPVVLEARDDQGTWQFKGKANLGWLHGGVYTYKGHAKGDDFFSTYDSSFDKGVFKLKRIKAPPEKPAGKSKPSGKRNG